MKYCALFFQMENPENKNQEENKTHSKMARLAGQKLSMVSMPQSSLLY